MNSIQNQTTIDHPNRILTDQSFTVLSTNTKNPFDGDVVVFLMHHKIPKHDQMVEKFLRENFSGSKPVILVEDPSRIEKMSDFACVRCWDDRDILNQLNRATAIFQEHQETLKQFTGTEIAIEQKIQTAKFIYVNAKKINLVEKIPSLSDLKVYLEKSSETGLLIQEKERLITLLGQIHQAFCHQTVHENFLSRQKTLMASIADHLKEGKVFVLCGKSHGDPKWGFPHEANMLIDYLRANTNYSVIDVID